MITSEKHYLHAISPKALNRLLIEFNYRHNMNNLQAAYNGQHNTNRSSKKKKNISIVVPYTRGIRKGSRRPAIV